jgi:cytochrome P450
MQLSAGLLLLVVVASLTTARLLQSYLRLAKIPGPFLARLTDLWRFRAQNSRGYAARLVELHKRHGNLVRLGPNHISVSDPSAIPIIYSTNPVWLKGPSYYGAATVSQGRVLPSIIAMSESQHTAVRKTVGRAFTTNSMLDYESFIDTSAAEFVRVIGQLQAADVGLWLQFFAMDMLIRIAFNETPGFMQKGGDVDGILNAVMDRFDHWGRWAAIPTADYLVNKGPLASRIRGAKDSPLARVGLAKFQARKSSPDQAELKDLCQKFLEGKAKHPDALSNDEILGIILSTIGAGADTTAGTLTYTLYFLSKHPEVRERLRFEIDEGLHAGTLSNPPKWAEVHKLPYLEAVLKESMRLLPIASWGLDRIVPAAGATISGKFIPGGTVVGCQIDAIHRDHAVYGKDSSVFRPERWIEADEEQRRRMDRAFLGFSAGKRICTGIHIAWLEMKKALPLILMNFNVSAVPPQNCSHHYLFYLFII